MEYSYTYNILAYSIYYINTCLMYGFQINLGCDNPRHSKFSRREKSNSVGLFLLGDLWISSVVNCMMMIGKKFTIMVNCTHSAVGDGMMDLNFALLHKLY